MEQQAHNYLGAALAILEQHAFHRARIDWPALRREAGARAAGARLPADTYAAIRWALTQLGDGHSFFGTPDRGDAAIASGSYSREATLPSGHMRPDEVAYLQLPGFRGTAQAGIAYAVALDRLIAELDSAGPIGWIVDLSQNGGGNMWPMLAGLGPLIGEGTIGAFEYPGGERLDWRYQAGRALLGDIELAEVPGGGYRLRSGMPPVALLVHERTASSGEAVVLAFAGRPSTRRFGTATRGLTSANEGFDLSDGATINLTVALFADRVGRVYDGPIEPDQVVQADDAELQTVAAGWLHMFQPSVE